MVLGEAGAPDVVRGCSQRSLESPHQEMVTDLGEMPTPSDFWTVFGRRDGEMAFAAPFDCTDSVISVCGDTW